MSSVFCPRCGAANEPTAAFCAACGNPMAAQSPAPPATAPPPTAGPPPSAPPPPVWQPPANIQQAPPGFPPPSAYPPPPGAYPPPLPGYPYQKITGNNTKWAIGLAVVSLFCCGPFTAVPGIIMAKKDMDDIAAGRAPHLDESWAKNAYYFNIIALVLSVIGLIWWWSVGGLRNL
jgi:zinc-ribbon domain